MQSEKTRDPPGTPFGESKVARNINILNLPQLWAPQGAPLGGQAILYPHIMTLIDKMMRNITIVLTWPFLQLV